MQLLFVSLAIAGRVVPGTGYQIPEALPHRWIAANTPGLRQPVENTTSKYRPERAIFILPRSVTPPPICCWIQPPRRGAESLAGATADFGDSWEHAQDDIVCRPLATLPLVVRRRLLR